MTNLDRKDLAWWASTVAPLLAVAAALHLAAQHLAPAGQVFSGFLGNPYDRFSYQAWALSWAEGGWLADNPYAAEPRAPRYFNLLWFALGKAQALLGVAFPTLAAAAFALCGAAMLLALLSLMREMISSPALARCAYLLAAFGGGVGWVVALASPDFGGYTLLTTDIYHKDAFPVVSVIHLSHSAFPWLALALVYRWSLRAAVVPGRGREAWYAAAAALALGFAHPYQLVSLLAVLGSWHGVLTLKRGRRDRRHWTGFLLLAAACLPPLLYYAWLFRTQPNFVSWGEQNVMRTIQPLNLVLGFGPLFPLALLAQRGVAPLRGFTDRYLLAVTWLLVNLGLVYGFPAIRFEARLVAGMIIPLAVLAAWGLGGVVLPALGARGWAGSVEADIREGAPVDPGGGGGGRGGLFAWAVALAVLMLPTHLLSAANLLRIVSGSPPYFAPDSVSTGIVLPRGVREALAALAGEARGRPVVVSAPGTGVYLPAFAPVRSFVGHAGLTPEYESRRAAAREVFDAATTHDRRLALLGAGGVSFLWHGPEERIVGRFEPRAAPYLTPVFDNGVVRLFRVVGR